MVGVCLCTSRATCSARVTGLWMATHRTASNRFPISVARLCLRAASTLCRTVMSDCERADLPTFPCVPTFNATRSRAWHPRVQALRLWLLSELFPADQPVLDLRSIRRAPHMHLAASVLQQFQPHLLMGCSATLRRLQLNKQHLPGLVDQHKVRKARLTRRMG